MFTGRRREHRPPGPRGHWLAGNLIDYEQDRLGYLLRLSVEFGAVVRFGSHTTIVNDPDLAAGLLRDSTEKFEVRENFLQQRLTAEQGRGIADLRAALNPGLRPKAVRPIQDIVARHLLCAMEIGTGASDTWFDPMPLLEHSISGAVAEYYFGPLDGPAIRDQVRNLLDELTTVIGNPFALPQSWGTAVRRRIALAHRDLRTVVGDLLKARGSRGSADDLACDILLRAGGRYPLGRVADMVVGSLLAAQRVPAAGAAWLLMLLADHPRAQLELHSHRPTPHTPIDRAAASVSRSGPSRVEQIVMESMRLYPPTWLISRTSTQPVSVGDFQFPASHNFMVSPYVLHRDPVHFPDPAEFRPERWADLARPPVAYLPFGAGIHACPGRHMATFILAAIARTVTADYTIVRKPGSVAPDPRTTLLPQNLEIALRRRPSSTRAPVRGRSDGVPVSQLPASADSTTF